MSIIYGPLAILDAQPWSIALRESTWAYAIIESIHVLTITVFVGFAVLLDLRLLGIYMSGTPVSRVAASLFPRTRAAFVLQLVTGSMLFYAKPLLTAHNVFFQTKIAVMILAFINIFVYHYIVALHIDRWDKNPTPPISARICGAVSIFCWIAVVCCGRFIAYNWFE